MRKKGQSGSLGLICMCLCFVFYYYFCSSTPPPQTNKQNKNKTLLLFPQNSYPLPAIITHHPAFITPKIFNQVLGGDILHLGEMPTCSCAIVGWGTVLWHKCSSLLLLMAAHWESNYEPQRSHWMVNSSHVEAIILKQSEGSFYRQVSSKSTLLFKHHQAKGHFKSIHPFLPLIQLRAMEG